MSTFGLLVELAGLFPVVDDSTGVEMAQRTEPPGPPAREEAELLVLTTAKSGNSHQTGHTEVGIGT